MKKLILTSLFLTVAFVFSNKALAQSVNAIQTKAIAAAKQAGYTTGPLNKITASANQIGNCGTTCTPKIKHEVYVAPKGTPTSRMAPFAKVIMCGLTVLSVENLRD